MCPRYGLFARTGHIPCAKLRTVCRQNDTAIGVPSSSPPSQNDDTREVQQVCQTWARKSPLENRLGGRHRRAQRGERQAGQMPAKNVAFRLRRPYVDGRQLGVAKSALFGRLEAKPGSGGRGGCLRNHRARRVLDHYGRRPRGFWNQMPSSRPETTFRCPRWRLVVKDCLLKSNGDLIRYFAFASSAGRYELDSIPAVACPL